MADRLFQQMTSKPWSVLGAFVSFYATSDHCEEAVNILEHHLPSFHGDYLQHPLTSVIGERTGWRLMVTALQHGRASLAKHLFETAASDTEKHVLAIQKWWKHGYANQLNEKDINLDAVLDVGSRMSNVFQSASLDLDEEVSLSLLFDPIKPPKKQASRRASSPDGSTSAGTLSDSDSDSADEWMTRAAWRPPPGLEEFSCAAVCFPDLSDPWCDAAC